MQRSQDQYQTNYSSVGQQRPNHQHQHWPGTRVSGHPSGMGGEIDRGRWPEPDDESQRGAWRGSHWQDAPAMHAQEDGGGYGPHMSGWSPGPGYGSGQGSAGSAPPHVQQHPAPHPYVSEAPPPSYGAPQQRSAYERAAPPPRAHERSQRRQPQPPVGDEYGYGAGGSAATSPRYQGMFPAPGREVGAGGGHFAGYGPGAEQYQGIFPFGPNQYGGQTSFGGAGGYGYGPAHASPSYGRAAAPWAWRTRRHRAPKGYVRRDERIREDLCDRIMLIDDLDASDVDVQVSDGEVTLSGTVHDRRSKYYLEEIADSIPGVIEVNNNLRIRRQSEAQDGPWRSEWGVDWGGI